MAIYGKIENGAVTFAPHCLKIGGTVYPSPTEEQYKEQGYKEIITDVPELEPGKRYKFSYLYEERDNCIVAHKIAEEIPAQPPQKVYERRVVALIRQKYSADDEIAILRRQISGDTSVKFEEYHDFAEACKAQARKEVFGNET